MSTLRLSEAIRIGAMSKPQAFGTISGLVRHRPFSTSLFGSQETVSELVIGTCAFGAAIDAASCPTRMSTAEEITSPSLRPHTGSYITVALVVPDDWKPVVLSTADCPECGHRDHVWRMVAHLNDDHRWTRERIADWLETIERGLGLWPDVEPVDGQESVVARLHAGETR